MAASRCFIVGAMARDLVLVNAFGLRSGGATRDIDFGLSVECWEEFQMLKTALVETGQFEATPKVAHRLIWKDPETGATTPVDLIPFGGVASEDKTIAWPPSRDFAMSVAGFEEASESAIRLQVEDDLVVRVASLPGLTVLKLIAWEGRRNESDKDAADLRHLLFYYGDAGNLHRLYEREMPLLEAAGFDIELAGAQLLGRDAARICHKDTGARIRALLDSEPLIDQLIVQMAGAGFLEDARGERISSLWTRFREGFLGG